MPKKLLRLLGSLLALALITIGTSRLAGLSEGASHSVEKQDIQQDPVKITQPEPEKPQVVTAPTIQTNALVVRTVDGDTIEVIEDGKVEKQTVRLLGINTPESVDPRRPVECFGKEASKRAKELIEGKRIRLDADVQADDRDKYGRILRKVTMEDGEKFNERMVAEGYAMAYVSFPMNAEYKRELKKLQEEARLAGRGLWAAETCNGKK